MGTYFTIVTCRNSENDIEKALMSLSNQTIKPSYIIVIDDGSKDNTGKVLKEISNSKLSISYRLWFHKLLSAHTVWPEF